MYVFTDRCSDACHHKSTHTKKERETKKQGKSGTETRRRTWIGWNVCMKKKVKKNWSPRKRELRFFFSFHVFDHSQGPRIFLFLFSFSSNTHRRSWGVLRAPARWVARGRSHATSSPDHEFPPLWGSRACLASTHALSKERERKKEWAPQGK